ncbi:hypothetical protein Acsp03_24680 [Actinomadura sp. NBRC 104412]|uniref:hypothetical protein n=1 Tax=Actinomadura sp. NBRC 104412 TaxID=3032203 RepID=UPI0024A2DE1F|nr:hypothetical protein [Actinomadura sp. NBRC 104412]GLZ05002.1 hypothetical protein Acsp03_24680 [Actinomadura sp. NBRC 104412]
MTTNENRPEDGDPGAVDDERLDGGTSGTSVPRSVLIAAELLAESADRERTIFEMAWNAGRAAGYADGFEHGYDRAEHDMRKAWEQVAADVRDLPRRQAVNDRRYPGYTAERLAELRDAARARYGLPQREDG